MAFENPPLPPGLKPLTNGEVTPPMSRWAIQVDGQPSSYPMHSVTVQTFDGRPIAARVEWHYEHAAGGVVYHYPPDGPWWGVTLYDATDYDPSKVPTIPPPTAQPLEGVDVSKYQGAIDWPAVRSQGAKDFAIIRVSDGIHDPDPTFETNWTQTRDIIPRGVYQFFRPGVSVEAQTDLLIAKVAGEWGEVTPSLDVEVLDGVHPLDVAAGISAWIDRIADESKQVPMIYTPPWLWSQLPEIGIGMKAALWVAQWGVARPIVPHGWGGWAMWQYSNGQRVPGISVPVDVDRTPDRVLPTGG